MRSVALRIKLHEDTRLTEEHDRVPQPSEERDIFERLYAVQLERLRGLESAIRF